MTYHIKHLHDFHIPKRSIHPPAFIASPRHFSFKKRKSNSSEKLRKIEELDDNMSEGLYEVRVSVYEGEERLAADI